MIRVFYSFAEEKEINYKETADFPIEWKVYLDGISDDSRRTQSYRVRKLLLYALRLVGVNASCFTADANGRWQIVDCTQNVDFSLSHTGALSVAVISFGKKTGVDAEKITDRILKLRERISDIPQEKSVTAEELTRIWTDKESSFKAGLKRENAFFVSETATDRYGERYVITAACDEENFLRDAIFKEVKEIL